MDAAEFQAAGLYDPEAPEAADRLALLRWLASRGATLEEMQEAHRARTLTALAGDLAIRPGPRVSLDEIAARLGADVERIAAVLLAAGLPPRRRDEPAYTADDAISIEALVRGAALFGDDAGRRLARVVGSALARVAEAAVSLYLSSVEEPLRRDGGHEIELARANLRAVHALDMVPAAMRGLLRAHVETAVRRLRRARGAGRLATARMTIGFVDLVGFTSLAHRLDASELGALVDRFEEAAHDVATARDGRVVKLIGDEVMFVAVDAAAACDIALALVERFAGDPAVAPRGGLAVGEVVVRGGDYYASAVNLASRIAELAVPGELLVTTEVAAEAASPALRFEPAGRRMLKGFAEPVRLFTVSRPPAT